MWSLAWVGTVSVNPMISSMSCMSLRWGARAFSLEGGKDARRQEEMDVHRVDVVDVPLHPERQGCELRDVLPQEPALVHEEERLVQAVRVRQDPQQNFRRSTL